MSYRNIWRAIKSDNMKQVSKLIRKSRRSNWNAFYHALMSNNLDCVKLMRKYFRPRTNSVSCDDGLTYLAAACKRSLSLDIVKYLLRLDKSLVHQEDYRNRTPLYYAVARDRFDIVELLLACGAVVNVTIQSHGPFRDG
uniref:ANK_REP_REGION domain-containing protein n=1 Tax=Anopheles dirus TaxID=7168 RepID=A0A182NX28_9DIPT